VNNPTKDYTFGGAGALAGPGGLTKDGDAKLTIANSGANTFNGAIDVKAGTLAFNQSGSVTVANLITGAGNLRQDGINVLTLSGTNTGFTGSITVASGTLQTGNGAALGDTATGTAVVNGATLDVGGVDIGNEPVTVQGAGVGNNGALINTATARADAANITLTADTNVGGTGTNDRTQGLLSIGGLHGNNHNLTMVGSNTVQFDDVGETSLGDIAVNGGNLLFYGTSTMGDPAKKVTLANNAILSVYDVNASVTHNKPIEIASTHGQFANWNGTNTVASTFTMNGNLTLLTGNNSLTLNGPLHGTGNLDRNNILGLTGVGTVYLVSNDNDYSGTTTVTSGTLSVGNGGTSGSLGGTGNITLGDNGILRFNRQGTNAISRNIVGTGTNSGSVRYGSESLNFNNTVFNVSGDNTYTGNTLVYGGTVVLSSDTGLGAAGTDKTIISNGNQVFACVALTGGITVAENFEMKPRSAYMPINATYAPHIQNLSGHNTLTGTIGTGTGGGGSQYTIRSDGTESGDLLTISGNVTCERPSASCGLWLRGPGKGEVTGVIQNGAGNWTALNVAEGEWTFSNANTYTCSTAVTSGTLKLTGSGSIASSPAIILNDAASVLDVIGLSGSELSLASSQNLIGTGTVKGNLLASWTYPTLSPSGVGTASALNLPGGTMTIQGNVNFSGGESLRFKLADDDASARNDQIVVTGNVTMPNTTVYVTPGASLETGTTYTLMTAANNFAAVSSFSLDPNHNTRYSMSLDTSTPGELNLVVGAETNKALTWTGTGSTADWDVRGSWNWKDNVDAAEQFYQADSVTFGDAVPGVATTVNLAATVYSGLVTVNSAQNYTISGTGKISGDTSIVKQGTGTLILSTANDFNGTLTILEGAVKPGGTKGLGSNNGGIVVNGGTLDLNGYYQPRLKPISVQGTGAGGNGALVNNANPVSEVPYLYYVSLAGNAVFGGSKDWSVQGNTVPYSGWASGYLQGNNHNLTKVGSNVITLADLGNTNLGDVTITGGQLLLSGNTDLGNTGKIALDNNAWLRLLDATVPTRGKTIEVAAGGGVIDNSFGTPATNFTGDGTLAGTLTGLVAVDTALTLSGGFSGPGGVTAAGLGTLILAGENTYEGDTTVPLSAGNTATLILASTGQISTASEIINDSRFQVDGGTHELGVVSGSGAMSVLNSASVTASSITQDTLSIGSEARRGASATPVPEPGTWALLLIGLLGVAGWRKIRVDE
jgi:fibronectin-binding autotransporter adhesin